MVSVKTPDEEHELNERGWVKSAHFYTLGGGLRTPARNGVLWNQNERKALAYSFIFGASVQRLAELHERTMNSISIQLERAGLLSRTWDKRWTAEDRSAYLRWLEGGDREIPARTVTGRAVVPYVPPSQEYPAGPVKRPFKGPGGVGHVPTHHQDLIEDW